MSLRVHYPTWQEAVRQIVTFWNDAFRGTRMAKGVDAKDDLIVDDDTLGAVLKSSDGHYWRITVNTAGALTTTDLGTTKP